METKKILEAINLASNSEDLDFELAKLSMNEIMSGEVTPAQFGAFIMAMKMKGETPIEIAGLATAMREKSLKIELDEPLLDTCGTGGDGLKTFNISTAVAFVVAGAGIKVAKHGNRAISGSSGSADALEELGVKITLTPYSVKKCIQEIGIGFIFAQSFHPAMKFASPLRKEIGIPTIFNILGPLTNPAGASNQLIGISNYESAEKVSEALKILGTENSIVVNGHNNLDEISIEGNTNIWQVDKDKVKRRRTRISDFGLHESNLNNLVVGSVKESVETIKDIFAGKGSDPLEKSNISSRRNAVIINSAAALVAAGKTSSFQDASEMSKTSIDSGAAQSKLLELIEISNKMD